MSADEIRAEFTAENVQELLRHAAAAVDERERPLVQLGDMLVDESLSARVASSLTQAGHDAVHLGDLGLLGAQDDAVLAAAGRSGRVLLSLDTDVGELLALGRQPGPSVVVFRRAQHRPERQVLLLLASLPDIEERIPLRSS